MSTPTAHDVRAALTPARVRVGSGWWVVAIALLAGLARLPLLRIAVGPDEGGFLLLASQWHPGSSLYGDYWVDRPPLLMEVFALADRFGGVTALRIIGIVLVMASVLLAARVASLVGGSGVLAAVVAAALLTTPQFGTELVNGELITTPFILGAIVLTLTAAQTTSNRRRTIALVAAGAIAAAAVMVKQNQVDGLIVLVVGAFTFLAARGHRRRTTIALAAAGAVGLAVAVLTRAAALGTSPGALWEAVVVFRLDATQVISASATSATSDRLGGLLLSLLVSGAPLLVLVLARPAASRPRDGRPDLRWALVALLAWEIFSITAGGSYWRHYLICLVPGLVLLVGVGTARLGRVTPRLRTVAALICLSTLVTTTVYLAFPSKTAEDPATGWLRDHATAGQTGVVAYGHPDILAGSGLTSPYRELWSLPVRVRDPELTELRAVLEGPDRPDWIVTGGAGTLAGWGIDSRAAQPALEAHYRLVAAFPDRRVYLDRDEPVPSPVGVGADPT